MTYPEKNRLKNILKQNEYSKTEINKTFKKQTPKFNTEKNEDIKTVSSDERPKLTLHSLHQRNNRQNK